MTEPIDRIWPERSHSVETAAFDPLLPVAIPNSWRSDDDERTRGRLPRQVDLPADSS